MNKAEAIVTPPSAVVAALEALWQLPAPGPTDLLKAPAFVRLREACQASYPDTGWDQTLGLALINALRSLGLPCLVQATEPAASTLTERSVQALHVAFQARSMRRTHLCPLDLASELPVLQFGAGSVRRFTAEELARLFDWSRLQRHYPKALPELDELARFQWLVVHEDVPATSSPGERAHPGLEIILSAPDPARIEPYASRLPAAVERTLFFLLLAPWEDWVEMPSVDWRPFATPWVFSGNADLFVAPPLPRSARTLNWTTQFGATSDGEQVEWETPVELPLRDEAAQAAGMLNEPLWNDLQRALQAPVFGTPVAHFLVRAFLADGIDEFLAHVTTVEAALGTMLDYQKVKGDRHRAWNATRRVATRVVGLLGSRAEGETYRELFDQRSVFLHGRLAQPISVADRVNARRLARRVTCGLVQAALSSPQAASRDDFLGKLLDQGAAMT